MTVTDVRPVGAIPAGWYPDPVDAAGFRWWSGETWTEHTSAPQPAIAVVAPAYVDHVENVDPEVVPDLSRFSRDPQVSGRTSSVSATTTIVRRKDPYRDRAVVSGIALVAAVIGLLAVVAGQLLELPDLILYLAGGTPFTIAAAAIVVAIRTGRGMMLAVIAAVLSMLNVGMVTAVNALDARDDLGTSLDAATSFERVLEQSVVDTTNTLAMPGVAVSADCPDIPPPAKGTVTDCTVTLDNGDIYLVHVTSKDGLGAMDLELVDVPIGNASSED